MNKVLIIVLVVFAVLVVVSGGAAYTFYNQVGELNAELSEIKKNPQMLAEEETQALVERVSQLILLPQDETPTIATVSDPEALKAQPFFVNAQAGDKVLIYANARKAILYDPVGHKIVEVAPINIGEGTQPPAPTPDETPEQ